MIDTVSLPNVSRYGDKLIFSCISTLHDYNHQSIEEKDLVQ